MVLYAVAYAGMFVSFIPFVSVLLPLKVTAVADPEHRVALLSAAALGGAAVASVANLVFGALSDRTYRRRRTRRPWILAGLVLLILAYALFHLSADGLSMLAAVGLLQIAINMMLAPIGAIMADEVPDAQKGLVAGLMGAAHPFSSLVAMGVALHGIGSEATRYALLCAIIAVLVAPLLLFLRERRDPLPPPPAALRVRRRDDFARIWVARMLVQVAGNGLSTYGLFYFLAVLGHKIPDKHHAEAASEGVTAIFAGVMIHTLLLTIAAGTLSDRTMRRKPFIAAAALVMAAGLAIMAAAPDWTVATFGFGTAMSGMAVFLALQSALAMQLLSPLHRGRDLGILNLTNTLPGMAAPLLALALSADKVGYGPWLLVLAFCVLAGGAVAMTVRTQN
ncbi:MFS transporter [Sphingomonas psychrotolerans]|uniref:MFS transporter n=1 Tax=Sphingomonas psychrotolerans TaxID=1327635 RepID=A0ABU3N3U9_9SPHN|nr:MFS transporter [Sphingomonas psychrotolerans]MDT8758544.1 MFS transporter [Sphingomonas psychrotolerans]